MVKKSLFFFFIIICFTLIVIFSLKSDEETVMECSANVTKIDGEAFESFTFYGYDDEIKSQVLTVKLYITDEELINNYKSIIENDSSCSNVIVYDEYISYVCSYSLVNNKYYEDLKNDKGILLFSSIKKEFEDNNYVCNYK